MHTKEYLKILKEGVVVWNSWRENNCDIHPKLDTLNLSDIELKYIDIWDVQIGLITTAHVSWDLIPINFSSCSLRTVNFSKSDLESANFTNSDLTGADFSEANLVGANFKGADLKNTKFDNAVLSDADFSNLDLTGISFIGAQIGAANFENCILDNTNFFKSTVRIEQLSLAKSFKGTILAKNKLKLKGFRKRTYIKRYGEDIIDKMLREMELYNEESGIYHSCFISYSSKDEEFSQKLHSDLLDKGVKCWFAPKDLIIGDKIRPTIYEAIKNQSKLLVIVSKDSISSNWVENEVESAFEQENILGENILFPIRIDNSVFNSDNGWSSTIRRQRHIGNFENWKEDLNYKKSLDRLLRDLRKNDN